MPQIYNVKVGVWINGAYLDENVYSVAASNGLEAFQKLKAHLKAEKWDSDPDEDTGKVTPQRHTKIELEGITRGDYVEII